MLTTSRYASAFTRNLAMALSILLGTSYSSRGKRTISALVELSRRSGDHRLFIIKERNKRPVSIDIIKIKEDITWQWVEPVGITYES